MVKDFLLNLGYEWKYCYWKPCEQTFIMANSFLDIESDKNNAVVLELFKGNKIWYMWFRISKESFQYIVSRGGSLSEECVEDYSEEWKVFTNNFISGI